MRKNRKTYQLGHWYCIGKIWLLLLMTNFVTQKLRFWSKIWVFATFFELFFCHITWYGGQIHRNGLDHLFSPNFTHTKISAKFFFDSRSYFWRHITWVLTNLNFVTTVTWCPNAVNADSTSVHCTNSPSGPPLVNPLRIFISDFSFSNPRKTKIFFGGIGPRWIFVQ